MISALITCYYENNQTNQRVIQIIVAQNSQQQKKKTRQELRIQGNSNLGLNICTLY